MKNSHRGLNYVDILLLAASALVFAILISVFFKNSSQIDFSPKETITLTLKVKDVPIEHSKLIKADNTLYYADTERVFGKVKYASYSEETVEFVDKLTNTSAIYKSPDKQTALLLVEASAELIGKDFYVSDCKLAVGDAVELFAPAYSFSATVVKIESDKE
ncbi:MAG: DUF4330 family protein [Clostridia bacterium]|nr:DUF4330 family protein [Clostridia bacterium]